MPGDTFAHSAVADATPEAVMAALQDAATWKGIGPIDDVTNELHDDDGLLSFTWKAQAAGKSWIGSAQRTALGADRMELELDSSEIAGSIVVGARPADGRTSVEVELRARSKGVLAGMFWGVIADALARGFPGQVEEFASQF